jgi:hypothetical protein
MSRLLGEDPPPYLASAVTLVEMADSVRGSRDARSTMRALSSDLARVAGDVGWADGNGWPAEVVDRYRVVAARVERSARGEATVMRELARALRVLADDLLARGLGALSYAAALGQPERGWLRAEDISARHDFGDRPLTGRTAAWDLPVHRPTVARAGFGVAGSLLGMDVSLAELWLVRMSLRPPPRRPMLSEASRRGFAEAVTLVAPAGLSDRHQDAIVAAIRTGRERVAAVRTTREAAAMADALRLDPARASLLAWIVTYDRAHLDAFFSLGELLWVGLGTVPHESPLHAWGAPARTRTGCFCLRLPAPQPWETVAGRAGSGMLASLFPDLNLRLAELLADARLPAALLVPVLASATLDFVNLAISRDDDDRRGLVEFVRGLDGDRLARYLALLTTDGPLVPFDGRGVPTSAAGLGP